MKKCESCLNRERKEKADAFLSLIESYIRKKLFWEKSLNKETLYEIDWGNPFSYAYDYARIKEEVYKLYEVVE